MEPTVWFPPTAPFTLQITPVFVLPFTTAVYCDEFPKVTLVVPVRVSVTTGGGGAASVTFRLRATEGSAMLVALIVTVEGPGAGAGGEENPFAEMQPQERFTPTP